jgi:hypothetical protein
MRRREFLGVLGGAAVAPTLLWPRAGHAQRGERQRTIGLLSAGGTPSISFADAMRQFGWIEGKRDFRASLCRQ